MDNSNRTHRYKCLKKLGEGSYGKAFLVQTPDEGLSVVKTVFIDDMNEKQKQESYLEAKILETLDHPNIIKLQEVYISKKPNLTLVLVMEYADGGDLSMKIKEQENRFFSENQIIDWFTQICLSVKHLHDKKIVHRDIKSQNIFLTKSGLIKLGDFGISRKLDSTFEKLKTVIGTPYYLSPEIVQNQPYSFKSDIWALGVLLYEICALKMPFEANNLPLLSLKITKGQFSPLPQVYSKELKNLVSFILNPDQTKRPLINDILKQIIIKSRIKKFLSEVEYNKEFSTNLLIKEANPKMFSKKQSQTENKKKIWDPIKSKKDETITFESNKKSYVNFYEKKKGYSINKDTNKNFEHPDKSNKDFQDKNHYFKNLNSTSSDEPVSEDSLKYSTLSENYSLSDSNYTDTFKSNLRNTQTSQEQKYFQEIMDKHKLMIELDHIEENLEDSLEKNSKIEEYIESVDMNDAFIDSDPIIFEACDDENQSADIQRNQTEPGTDLNEDFSKIECMKIELEDYLGDYVFAHLYQIIEKYYSEVDSVKYNRDKLKQTIIDEFQDKYDEEIIEKCMNKVPEVFTLILKENLANLNRNKNMK